MRIIKESGQQLFAEIAISIKNMQNRNKTTIHQYYLILRNFTKGETPFSKRRNKLSLLQFRLRQNKNSYICRVKNN